MNNDQAMSAASESLTKKQVGVLLISLLVISLCGIVYQLIISAISSYLLGNSVFQFSITIGLFMFGMGIGSIVTKYLDENFLRNFVVVELAIAAIGGLSGVILFVVFPYLQVIYQTVMYLIIFVIGVLVGMEIPIVSSVLARQQSARKSIADVMSFDYLGALVGSIVFPLLLLPQLGLIQSSFVIGLINAVVALISCYSFRGEIRSYGRYMKAGWLVVVLLTVGLFSGATITRFNESTLFRDQVIGTEQSAYQKITLTRNVTTDDLRLYIDGHIQFSSKDEYRYHEFLVHPAAGFGLVPRNVLILGGGEGLAAREVLKYDTVETVTIVDLDPAITSFARNNRQLNDLGGRSLESPKVAIVHQDAFNYVRSKHQEFDLVIIDLPDPHNEVLSKLYSVEFYRMVRGVLRPEGVMVTQSSSPFYTPRAYWAIEATLAQAFSHTLSYQIALPSFGIWGFHIASAEPIARNNLLYSANTRAFDQVTFKRSLQFEKDIQKIEGLTVNSLANPKIYKYYMEDLNKREFKARL